MRKILQVEISLTQDLVKQTRSCVLGIENCELMRRALDLFAFLYAADENIGLLKLLFCDVEFLTSPVQKLKVWICVLGEQIFHVATG